MSDDFNVPAALAVLFELAKSINICKESDDFLLANELATCLTFLAKPLGILQQDPESYLRSGVEISREKIDSMLLEREGARSDKNFDKSDRIRDELLELNIVLEDSPEGTTWRKK